MSKRFGDPDIPAVTPQRVAGRVAPETQENEHEARRLVNHLHEMLRPPAYAEASFAVICLFLEEMRLVSELVASQIPEELRMPLRGDCRSCDAKWNGLIMVRLSEPSQ